MSQSLFALVLGGMVASAGFLTVLALVVLRETRRTLAFDRRLGVARRQALASASRAEDRSRRPGRERGDAGPLLTSGRMLVHAASMLVPVGAEEREKLSRLLRAAGFGQADALSYFLAVKLGAGAVLGAAIGYLVADSEVLGQYGLLVAVAAGAGLVVGGVLPEYVLRARVAGRLRRMTAAFPDALDLMVMCLESGLTFERALTTAAEELTRFEPNLAAEFRLIEAELRLGGSRRTVLQALQDRTEVDGLKDLAMSLIQSDRYGTPLAQSMKNIAAAERIQRAARITAQAERLPVLMTLPMLLFVVPGTMLLVAGPAFISAVKALGGLGR